MKINAAPLIAAILFAGFLPLLLVIGILIKLKYPGSIFYKQIREGKNGKTFHIFKLRTMAQNANELLDLIMKNNPLIAKEWQEYGCLKQDPRITGKLGHFARQFSIDEIPQLLNVIRGEMNFIGPRPLESGLAEMINPQKRMLRNSILPGITGLWQVGPRSTITIHQMQRYDLIYVKKRTVYLDLIILFKTIQVVFKRTGF